MSKILSLTDICKAAKRLRCEAAAIRAVDAVESAGGGFLPSGKLKILFERHHFSRLTKRKFDSSHPQISSRTAGGYHGGENEYLRFNKAFDLDPTAAMMSTSWGRYQIMGFNHGIVGFKTVADFVTAMRLGEGAQLLAFCAFVEHNNLDDELRRRDWAGFARGYNGAAYRKNRYDDKLAAAYAKFAGQKIDCDAYRAAQPKPAVATAPSPTETSDLPTPAPTVAIEANPPNSSESSVSQPPVFTPDTIVQTAPPTENSTRNGVLGVLAAFGVPAGLGGIVQAIKDLVANGFIDAREVGAIVLGIIRENSKYVIILVGLVLLGLMLKKFYRQATLLLTTWINSDPNRHNVEVRPHGDV